MSRTKILQISIKSTIIGFHHSVAARRCCFPVVHYIKETTLHCLNFNTHSGNKFSCLTYLMNILRVCVLNWIFKFLYKIFIVCWKLKYSWTHVIWTPVIRKIIYIKQIRWSPQNFLSNSHTSTPIIRTQIIWKLV